MPSIGGLRPLLRSLFGNQESQGEGIAQAYGSHLASGHLRRVQVPRCIAR